MLRIRYGLMRRNNSNLFLDFKNKFPHSNPQENTDADYKFHEAQVPRERV